MSTQSQAPTIVRIKKHVADPDNEGDTLYQQYLKYQRSCGNRRSVFSYVHPDEGRSKSSSFGHGLSKVIILNNSDVEWIPKEPLLASYSSTKRDREYANV